MYKIYAVEQRNYFYEDEHMSRDIITETKSCIGDLDKFLEDNCKEYTLVGKHFGDKKSVFFYTQTSILKEAIFYYDYIVTVFEV